SHHLFSRRFHVKSCVANRRTNETRLAGNCAASGRRGTYLRRHHAQNGASWLSHRYPRSYARRNRHARHSGDETEGSSARGENTRRENPPESRVARRPSESV